MPDFSHIIVITIQKIKDITRAIQFSGTLQSIDDINTVYKTIAVWLQQPPSQPCTQNYSVVLSRLARPWLRSDLVRERQQQSDILNRHCRSKVAALSAHHVNHDNSATCDVSPSCLCAISLEICTPRLSCFAVRSASFATKLTNPPSSGNAVQ